MVALGRAMPGSSAEVVQRAGVRLMAAASKHLRAWEGYSSLKPPHDDYGDESADPPRLGYWERMGDAAIEAAKRHAPVGWHVCEQRDPQGVTLWLATKADDEKGWGNNDSRETLRMYPPQVGFSAHVFERAR